jgi:hypothetical protein
MRFYAELRVPMIPERSKHASLRAQQQRPTKRQLALIAWTVAHPARDASFGERAMIAIKLTQWLTEAEQRQVSKFFADETAMRKALKKRLTKRRPTHGNSRASRL